MEREGQRPRGQACRAGGWREGPGRQVVRAECPWPAPASICSSSIWGQFMPCPCPPRVCLAPQPLLLRRKDQRGGSIHCPGTGLGPHGCHLHPLTLLRVPIPKGLGNEVSLGLSPQEGCRAGGKEDPGVHTCRPLPSTQQHTHTGLPALNSGDFTNLPSPSQFVPGPRSGEAGQTWGSAALLFLKATLAKAGRGQGWGSQQADVPTSLFTHFPSWRSL